MEDIKTGGPAFPTVVDMAPELHEGMTLRDYFAAKAMQSGLARSSGLFSIEDVIDLAKGSYRIADAMLAAREGGAK